MTRKIRRAQTLTPFGIGAIVDMLGESFVGEDISRWRGPARYIHAPRIAALFGVDRIQQAPGASEGNGKVPYFRFPQQLFCGGCRSMVRWSPRDEENGKAPTCRSCRGGRKRGPALIPMRFVAVCGDGHLSDVDWRRWAHSDRDNTREQFQCRVNELSFQHVDRVGGGLESLQVRCRRCHAHRNLQDLAQPGALTRIKISCTGRQPWQNDVESVTCSAPLAVLQRGASSVYYSTVLSAIDIPPDSSFAFWGGPRARIEAHEYFRPLCNRPDTRESMRNQLIEAIAEDTESSTDQVRALLAEHSGGEVGAYLADSEATIASREWSALITPQPADDPRDHFISHRVAGAPAETRGLLADVIVVDRLREVRALLGFARHTMDKIVSSDLGAVRSGTIPGGEVFGEGIFLRFDEDAVRDWEAQPTVRDRARVAEQRLDASPYRNWLKCDVTPRLLLLHTTAHVLLRQIAFDAGYSSSSLRERVYAVEEDSGDPMAGILIYTAAGDSEGTLGGLARAGEAEHIGPTLRSAVLGAEWCSLDPVCRETHGQGPYGLSAAACHACSLVSETSCVMGNVLLDRMMLVDQSFGFFRKFVDDALKAGGVGI